MFVKRDERGREGSVCEGRRERLREERGEEGEGESVVSVIAG